jgi:polar amino acid transport system substrate-binding protein
MRARMLSRSWLGAFACLAATLVSPGGAQAPSVAKALAPTGELRVGVLMVPFLATADAAGQLKGVVPDLGAELARRLGVSVRLVKFADPGALVDAFRKRDLDATFITVTAERSAVFDFGPAVLDPQTTYLVPAGSTIKNIDDVDRPGVRLLVPSHSSQETYLKRTIRAATMISVPVENPKQAVDKLSAGEADAFSHVVPMLVSAQRALPGSRILPGSYFNVSIAIGYAKERPVLAADYAKQFVEDIKKSGYLQQSLDRAGESVRGVVVNR